MYTFNMQAYSKPYQNTITWNQDVNQILKTWGVICSPGLQKTERNRGSREQGRQRGVFLSLNIFFFSLIALHFFFFWFVQVLWNFGFPSVNWLIILLKPFVFFYYYWISNSNLKKRFTCLKVVLEITALASQVEAFFCVVLNCSWIVLLELWKLKSEALLHFQIWETLVWLPAWNWNRYWPLTSFCFFFSLNSFALISEMIFASWIRYEFDLSSGMLHASRFLEQISNFASSWNWTFFFCFSGYQFFLLFFLIYPFFLCWDLKCKIFYYLFVQICWDVLWLCIGKWRVL